MNFEQKTARVEEFEQHIEELEASTSAAQAHREAITGKTQACDERVNELQAREFEEGAHLLAGNVE